jgi:hypothetical protein
MAPHRPHPVSGHLLNATALLLVVAVALAVDRFSIGSAANTRSADGAGLSDVAEFIGAAHTPPVSRREVTLRVDPFGGGDAVSVASPRNASSVSGGAGSTRQLTAILVANNRPVAVVDDEVVGVGDHLRDGARVSRIQSDRVFLIDKNGKWHTLTLAVGRP